MPRAGDATRQRILHAAYTQFRRKGFTRVGVDEIALAAKVTKRTLYYHFRSKDALLAAVLAEQHDMALAAFRTFGDRLAGSPAQIADAFFRELLTWTATPRWAGSGFSRLAMELADLPGHPARAVARRHKAALEAALADLLAAAGAKAARERARELWLLAEGAMVMVLIHGERGYVSAAGKAAATLLQAGAKRALRPRRRRG